MIILISGASHTGKTVLAQQLLEKYHYPYLCMDHLKMGLIRSGNTDLTVYDDKELIDYLWPIVCGIIKTAIENKQNLIIEGCYIPFSWRESFDPSYLEQIRAFWLIMSKSYVENHFEEICAHANDIEARQDDSDCSKSWLITENLLNLDACQKHGCDYFLIDHDYKIGEIPCLM